MRDQRMTTESHEMPEDLLEILDRMGHSEEYIELWKNDLAGLPSLLHMGPPKRLWEGVIWKYTDDPLQYVKICAELSSICGFRGSLRNLEDETEVPSPLAVSYCLIQWKPLGKALASIRKLPRKSDLGLFETEEWEFLKRLAHKGKLISDWLATYKQQLEDEGFRFDDNDRIKHPPSGGTPGMVLNKIIGEIHSYLRGLRGLRAGKNAKVVRDIEKLLSPMIDVSERKIEGVVDYREKKRRSRRS